MFAFKMAKFSLRPMDYMCGCAYNNKRERKGERGEREREGEEGGEGEGEREGEGGREIEIMIFIT